MLKYCKCSYCYVDILLASHPISAVLNHVSSKLLSLYNSVCFSEQTKFTDSHVCMYIYIYMCVCVCVWMLGVLDGISSLEGYLMPNSVYTYMLDIYDL